MPRARGSHARRRSPPRSPTARCGSTRGPTATRRRSRCHRSRASDHGPSRTSGCARSGTPTRSSPATSRCAVRWSGQGARPTSGPSSADAQAWRPYRSYAMLHLWALDAQPSPAPTTHLRRHCHDAHRQRPRRRTGRRRTHRIGTFLLAGDGARVVHVEPPGCVGEGGRARRLVARARLDGARDHAARGVLRRRRAATSTSSSRPTARRSSCRSGARSARSRSARPPRTARSLLRSATRRRCARSAWRTTATRSRSWSRATA